MKTNETSTPAQSKKLDWKKLLKLAMPYMGLIAVVVVFAILSGGKLFRPINMKQIINLSTIVIVSATGAVFVYALGGLDLSIGACIGLSSMAGATVATLTGSVPLTLVTCLVVGALTGLANATLMNKLMLPSFVATLAIRSCCTAITKYVTDSSGTSGIRVEGDIWVKLDTIWVKLIAIVVVIAICAVIFRKTRVGRYVKAIGGNSTASAQSGVKVNKLTMIAFLISGLCVGVAAMLTVIRYRLVNNTSGEGVEMDVILALVLGGMSLRGGSASKISAAVVGALTITTLNVGLLICGVKEGHIQMIRGVVFMIILLVTILDQHNINLKKLFGRAKKTLPADAGSDEKEVTTE